MSRRDRVLAALIVAVIHIAAFAPTIGSYSSVLDRGFWPQSEAILAGHKPYAEVNFEYPPLALPLVIAPAAVTDGLPGYRSGFEIEMLGFDLAIVGALALALPGAGRRVWEALGVYTIGVVAVSGVVLGESAIEAAPLALARFDLAVALLVLGAALARGARRSALWGALLGIATAVKAFPALLFPNLARDDDDLPRAAYAALVPLVLAASLVLAMGDEFGSAINYHTGRGLQIETLGATPLLIGHLVSGSPAASVISAGGYDVAAPGADAARWISFGLLAAGVLALIREGWVRRTPPLIISTAILATVVVFAPVLSPQFLLWVLPLSAAAYGLGRENVALIACFVLTEIVLHNYAGVDNLAGNFVWTLAARNALLLVYMTLVVIPVFREYPEPAWTSSS